MPLIKPLIMMPPGPPGVARSLESQCYRWALWLCPPVFRREHGDEMSRDFDEARGEAAARGAGALWTLRFVIAIDLARTAGVQWLRTGLPVAALALVAIAVQIAIAVGLAASVALARHVTRPTDNLAHDEALTVLLIVTTVMVIGITIAINLWVTRLNRRRRRR